MPKPKNDYAIIQDFQGLATFVGERFEHVDHRFEQIDHKLDQRFGTVVSKLDAVMNELQSHREEDLAGVAQLRRHEDQLQDHDARIAKLENAPA